MGGTPVSTFQCCHCVENKTIRGLSQDGTCWKIVSTHTVKEGQPGRVEAQRGFPTVFPMVMIRPKMMTPL